jgi:hypothetical protein
VHLPEFWENTSQPVSQLGVSDLIARKRKSRGHDFGQKQPVLPKQSAIKPEKSRSISARAFLWKGFGLVPRWKHNFFATLMRFILLSPRKFADNGR